MQSECLRRTARGALVLGKRTRESIAGDDLPPPVAEKVREAPLNPTAALLWVRQGPNREKSCLTSWNGGVPGTAPLHDCNEPNYFCGTNSRIRLLAASLKKTLPSASVAMPVGKDRRTVPSFA